MLQIDLVLDSKIFLQIYKRLHHMKQLAFIFRAIYVRFQSRFAFKLEQAQHVERMHSREKFVSRSLIIYTQKY